MKSVLLSSATKKAIENVFSSVVNMAKDMDFNHAIDTTEIMTQTTELRQLVYDQQDRSSYLLMEKIVDALQNITHTLEKVNEF